MKITEITDKSDSAKFSINSSYQGFADRQKNIFDQLNIAEHNSRNLLNNNAPMEVDDFSDTTPVTDDNLVSFERKRVRMRQFQGKESIFKKPQARPPRGILNRRLPDYQINPHKWTRYSLGDVKSEDMSERANTSAAMSFLKEMELRKSQSEELQDNQTPHKIMFKKTSRGVGNKECPSVSSFRNSKLVMPEYVVGQKKVQKQKEKKIKENSDAKEIKLGHLLEEDQDNEDV
ncbi:hypothetical protein ILUMI_13250 [Ignelater luminosus]|uniref:U5 small nuclear ribonucleoprotein TSSC4 n=1 Tax=Ignelater luminosus TaxID=2038154 RepID=A0A8K0CSQ7_IGNLU|nr:hypothetical protein ILUMI_13250 [Ignelater luminosus]